MHNEYSFKVEPNHTSFFIHLRWNQEKKVEEIFWNRTPHNAPHFLSAQQVPREIMELVDAIQKYFKKREPLPISFLDRMEKIRWTPFSEKVYRTISKIPCGETRTYAWVARKMGNPKAARAVGQALRRNPVPLLVPCHRVVSSQGMGGFMGEDNPQSMEIKFKHWLLQHEHPLS